MRFSKKMAVIGAAFLVAALVLLSFFTPRGVMLLPLRRILPLSPENERYLTRAISGRRAVKIGIAGPLEDIRDTNLFMEGVEMAVTECNAVAALPVSIELSVADDHNRIADALTAAGNFARDTEVVCVIGHWGSEFSMAAAQVYENAGVIMLTPVSTNPRLTESNFNLVFRNAPTDIMIGKFLADYAGKQGFENVAVLYSADMTGMQVSYAFEGAAEQSGISVIDKHSVYYDHDSFNKSYERWKRDGLDALMIADIITRNEDFRQKMIAKNPFLPILATDAYDYDIPLLRLSGFAKSLSTPI